MNPGTTGNHKHVNPFSRPCPLNPIKSVNLITNACNQKSPFYNLTQLPQALIVKYYEIMPIISDGWVIWDSAMLFTISYAIH